MPDLSSAFRRSAIADPALGLPGLPNLQLSRTMPRELGALARMGAVPTNDSPDSGVFPPTYDTDPQRQAKYLAEQNWRGLSDLALGTGDVVNDYVNAGIRDADFFTGGGLSGGKYDPYQFGHPSQDAADLASAFTGAEVIPQESMPPDVQQQGADQRAVMGMLPVGPESLAPVLKAAIGPVARTFKHPISGVKLRTPIEEMQPVYKPFGEMREKKLLHPEWLLGKTVVPMRGDPAAAGMTLTGLNGRTYADPVDLYGGEGYPRMQMNIDKGLGWASQPGAAATQANRAAEIYKNTGGKDVVGVYQKMGERSTAFNTMLSETLLQEFKLNRSKISNADVKEFDRIMREVPLKVKKNGKADRPAYPDWPGLDKLTPEYLRKGGGSKGDGKVRNKMFDLMDSKLWQDKNFPNTGAANFATTDADLLNKPTHTFGGATVTYDPEGRTIDNSGHPTYSRGVVAREEGVLPDIPLDVMAPDYRTTGGTNGGPIPNSQLEKFLMTKPPLITVDDKTLERFMKYLRSQEGFKWGIGGAVAAGIISEEQARELAQGQDTGAEQ